jgi:dsRNA-specific ribonuclease
MKFAILARGLCSNAFHQEASAFAARAGLSSILSMDLLKQALTHKSFEHGRELYNERLEFLGRHILKHLATEFVHFKYPRLPLGSLEEALNVYVGEHNLARTGRELGLGYAIRWSRIKSHTDPDGARGETAVLAKGICSLIGAIYHQKVT